MNHTIKMCVENMRSSLNNMTIDKFVVDTIETLMQIERREYLNQAENDKGNGYYQRLYHSLSKNSMMINVPRTRTGAFKPQFLELIKINQEQVNDLCLALYKKGMTTRDVEDLIGTFFGESVSHAKVSYLAEQFSEMREAWENTEVESNYLVIFCDCTFITVRRGDRYESEAVYICYGVREDFRREVLALEITPTESSSVWEDIFDNLIDRGLESVGLVVSDGLIGMKEAVLKKLKTVHQSCVVHKMRNILKRVSPKDRGEVARDLKEVFNNFEKDSKKDKAIKKCKEFVNKWSGKYRFKRFFKESELDSLFRYIDFDHRVRRMIYTTNSIENLNRIIKKATKNKLSFESPNRLLDYVFIVIKDFEDRNWMKYPVHNYKYFKCQTQST